MTRNANNVNEMEPKLKIPNDIGVPGHQGNQKLVGALDLFLAQRRLDNFFGVFRRHLHHIFLLTAKFFAQLVVPLTVAPI